MAVQVGTPHRLVTQLALEDLHPAAALRLAAAKAVAPLLEAKPRAAPLLVVLLREGQPAVLAGNLADQLAVDQAESILLTKTTTGGDSDS